MLYLKNKRIAFTKINFDLYNLTVAGLLSMIWTKSPKIACADTVLQIVSANQEVPATGPSMNFAKSFKRNVPPQDSQILSQDFHNHRTWVPGTPKRNRQTKTLSIHPFPNKPFVFTCLQYKSFENIVGKREIARNEQFLLFQLCFLSILRTFCHFN